MNTVDYVVLALLIITNLVLFLEVIYFIIRRNTTNKLIRAAFERNEEKFDKTSNSFFGKILSDFDKQLIKFNVAEIQKDNNRIEESIKVFDNMKLSNSQIKKLYPKIIYHYIDRNKKQEAKKCYEELSKFDVYKNKKEVDMTYDIYINESHKYLDESLAKLNKVKKEELPTLEKKIAKMYENKKINAEAKKYERLAERHLRELENSKRR